jgi:hypothetical protein
MMFDLVMGLPHKNDRRRFQVIQEFVERDTIPIRKSKNFLGSDGFSHHGDL